MLLYFRFYTQIEQRYNLYIYQNNRVFIRNRGDVPHNYYLMLTGSMLEKFTKRIQGLSKQKQQKIVLPHYHIVQEELSESISSSPQHFLKQHSEQYQQKVIQRPEFAKGEDESSSIKEEPNQQNSGSGSVGIINEDHDTLLKKIKSKIALSKQEKNSENRQSAFPGSSQNNSNGVKKQKNAKILQQTTPSSKQVSDQSEKSVKQDDSPNEQEEKKLSDAENSKKKRALVTEVLKVTASMQPEQKTNYYRNVTKSENLPSTHELKVWIDSLQMVFKVEQQLKKMEEQPNEKIISKKFAQRFIKYVQNNINEKRYKFRRICSIALKQLNLTTQKVDNWLNRFMNQNSKYLKGINLSQYEISTRRADKNIGPAQIKTPFEFQPVKQKKILSQSNGKQFEKKQVDKKQSVSPAGARNIKALIKQAEIKSTKPIKMEQKVKKSFSDQSSLECQNEDSDSFSESSSQSFTSQKQKSTKNKKMNDKRKQKLKKRQKINETKKRKEKKETQIERKIQPKKQIKMNNQEPQTKYVLETKKTTINQPQTPKLMPPTSAPIPQKLSTQSTAYPESFAKKLSAKLDIAFSQALESILKQKCEQYCVEEEALKDIYDQYGTYFLKKNQRPVETTQIAMKPQQAPAIPVIPAISHESMLARNHSNNFSQQLNSYTKPAKSMSQYWNSVERFTPTHSKEKTIPEIPVDRKKVVAPPPPPVRPQVIPDIEQIDREKVISSVRVPEESKVPESMKQKISSYEILGQKISQFLRLNLGCSEAAIRNEAFRLVNTLPQLVGKINEDSLQRWISSFLQKNKQKINFPTKQAEQSSYSNSNPKMKTFPPPPPPLPTSTLTPPQKMMMKPSIPPGYQNQPRFPQGPMQAQRPVIPIRNEAPRTFHIAPPKRNPVQMKGNGVPTQYQHQFQNGQN